ncbi:MAG: efflux RND transporter periplasmic adaptor subunit [Planctomycetaceae bacterium]
MKPILKIMIIVAVIAALGYYGVRRGQLWLAARNQPQFRTAEVQLGDLRISVNATGEVNPVVKVKVGSFVSGPIDTLHVDYNSEVTKGQLLAEIDPRIYDAAVARDKAALKTRLAEVDRVKAELQRATNDEGRASRLREENAEFISQAELDQYRFSRIALEAQLQVAEAGVSQAEANLENSTANVGYTRITSPVDGMIIDRLIDPGQTLAAQFQTPEMFVIAPGMREMMHITAAVDEADIGLIRSAQDSGQPIFFTVDSYPDEVFRDARIEQIRISPTVSQNVVTYPVIVATPNPDLKLLPGMTASLTFQVVELRDVIKLPNEALRFNPEKTNVRESDQHYLELSLQDESNEEAAQSALTPPVDEVVAAASQAADRVIWVRETAEEAVAAGRTVPEHITDGFSGLLRAVEVVVGESDYRFTQVLNGELRDGDEVVTGLRPREAK